MKTKLFLLLILVSFAIIAKSQNIDELIAKANYKECISLCQKLLKQDSTNADLYYKSGVAYQNLFITENALKAYRKAVMLAPENNLYVFTLAKMYYSNGKSSAAIPLFSKLYKADSLNFINTYYLADAYYQKGATEQALALYQKMNKRDTTNILVIDRLAACFLKKGWTRKSINTYRKSLEVNENGISAIKNLSYIYYKTGMPDSALILLDKGIKADSSDVDLYARRGDVYYGQLYYYKSQADYQHVLMAGDTSAQMLKRIGMGLIANDNNVKAEAFLLKSYLRDTTDAETCVFLAKCYLALKNSEKKDFYFAKAVKQVSLFYKTLAGLYSTMGAAYMSKKLYKESSEYFKQSLEIDYDSDTCLFLANSIYEYYLQDFGNALKYYKLYLENPLTGKGDKKVKQINEKIEKLKLKAK